MKRWRRVCVSPVVDDVRTAESPFEHLCRKLICVSQVSESDHIVLCFSVCQQSQCGNNLDPQPLCQERSLLYVQFDEFGLDVLLCQDGQVFVEDLTSVCEREDKVSGSCTAAANTERIKENIAREQIPQLHTCCSITICGLT